MSSPTVSTFQPGMLGCIIAKLVLPHALGNAAATWNTRPRGFVTLTMSMCSASQPSSRAIVEAMRRANAFLASTALPPYAEPNDQISRVSGKCEMYFVSLHGHGTSCSWSPRGAPTEWMALTQLLAVIRSRAGVPIRVRMPVLTTTYGESVTCTPSRAIGDPIGPIENGTTYIVRPFIDPANSGSRIARIFFGATQLFVGPASASSLVEMNVDDSTRATSRGSLRATKLFGRCSAFTRMSVPDSTISRMRRSASARDPSHHTMASGVVSAAICSTHATTEGCATTGAWTAADVSVIGAVGAVRPADSVERISGRSAMLVMLGPLESARMRWFFHSARSNRVLRTKRG